MMVLRLLDLKGQLKVGVLKNKCIKKLVFGLRCSSGGRNNLGRITVRHRGGGHKRLLRLVDFRHILWDITGIVIQLEYDPLRTGKVALVCYSNGMLSYKLASEGLYPGYKYSVGKKGLALNNENYGYVHYLKNFKDGFLINSVGLYNNGAGVLARSAGTFVTLVKVNYLTTGMSLIKLPSKEERLVSSNTIGTVGRVSNVEHNLRLYKKAGDSRHRGIRPTVRGVAMNPIDHPHGGGEGKTSGARGRRAQMSFTGKIVKGVSKKKKNKYILISRKGVLLRKILS